MFLLFIVVFVVFVFFGDFLFCLLVDGSLIDFKVLMMKIIVLLIFFFFWVLGIVYGYVVGIVESYCDIIKGMFNLMSMMGYYIVMVFFVVQFIVVFIQFNVGLFVVVKGVNFLCDFGLLVQVMIVGIILFSVLVNLFVGLVLVKWVLLLMIFVLMFMEFGIFLEFMQVVYCVGDLMMNIVMLFMLYFLLVVVFCQCYVKSMGIGIVVLMMLFYLVVLLIMWMIFLLIYWIVGVLFGFQGGFVYLLMF